MGSRVARECEKRTQSFGIVDESEALRRDVADPLIGIVRCRNEDAETLGISKIRDDAERSTPRAPSGWQMLACQLTQDDAQITLYTFMPPKKVASWPDQRLFVSTLAERSMIEAGRLPLREMAEQRRILAAENERWTDGAELTADAFVQVMSLLSAHVSETPHT